MSKTLVYSLRQAVCLSLVLKMGLTSTVSNQMEVRLSSVTVRTKLLILGQSALRLSLR